MRGIDDMQTYDYRPNAGKMALGIVFFAACAVYGFVDASGDHRAMLIDGLIYLAPDQATVFRWALAFASVGLAAGGVLGLVQALMGDLRLHVGDEAVEMPKSLFRPGTVTIAYRDIVSLSVTAVRRQRFLRLKTAKGRFNIVEARLTRETFETVVRTIAEGRERARSKMVSGGHTPDPRPTPPAPQPVNPSAPRPFGRRT